MTMTNQKNKDITEKENQEIGANGNEDKEYVQQFNADKKKREETGEQDAQSAASTPNRENLQPDNSGEVPKESPPK